MAEHNLEIWRGRIEVEDRININQDTAQGCGGLD